MSTVEADKATYFAAESGDRSALFDLFALYRQSSGPSASAHVSWLFSSYIFQGSRRLEQATAGYSFEPPAKNLLQFRREMLQITKGTAAQSIPVILYGKGCVCAPSDRPVGMTALEGMSDDRVSKLIRSALYRVDIVLRSQPAVCEQCKAPAKPEFLDYVQFFDEDRDLLVRCFPVPGQNYQYTYAVFLWHRNGRLELARACDWSGSESYADRLKRIIELFAADERIWAKAALTRAIRMQPQSDLNLQLVRFLRRPEDRGLAEAIISDHLQRNPNDHLANYWMAELLMQTYIFTLQLSLLEEAWGHCQRALNESRRVMAPNKETELLACTIARLLNKPKHIVEEMYQRLLRFHSDYPELLYDYALFVGQHDPLSAAHLFEKGRRMRPEDPEYASAKARMLALAQRGASFN